MSDERSPGAQSMNTVAIAVIALHAPQPWPSTGHYYCAECTSPIDGGPELWPCMTFKAVIDGLAGRVLA